MNENPVLSRPPPPPPLLQTLCRGLLLPTFVANDWRRYALQKNLVTKGLVASQEILLQTYSQPYSNIILTMVMVIIPEIDIGEPALFAHCIVD